MVKSTVANFKKIPLIAVIDRDELLLDKSSWNRNADDFFTIGVSNNMLSTPISNVILPININAIAKPYKSTIMFRLLDLYHEKNLCASSPNSM